MDSGKGGYGFHATPLFHEPEAIYFAENLNTVV
jgi:hypothetical protein